MKKFKLRSTVAAIAALGLLSTYALAQMGGGQFTKTAVVQSGVKAMVAAAHSSQVQGSPVPYTVKSLTSPKHGTVSIVRGGDQTRIFYQSKKGYVGEDSFQFARIANDSYGGTYTVAVTVK